MSEHPAQEQTRILPLWLTEDEIAALTKCKRVPGQVRELMAAGIDFRMVAGRPLVLVSALEPVAESRPRPQVKKLA